jgi:hypothetical protein
VIDTPPSAPGAKAIDTEPSPGVATNEVGAAGVVRGVDDTADETAPSPMLFTARNLIVYSVPLDRPVIEIGEFVAAGERVVQFTPLSVEYL